MARVELKHLPLRPANPLAGWGDKLRSALLSAFILNVFLVCVRLWRPEAFFGEATWPDSLLLLLCTGSTLACLSQQLPAQNVALASVVIAFAGGAAHTLSAVTGVPFGPLEYHPDNIGRMFFHTLPWTVPLIWVVALLNSRGVARLILRRWRTRDGYGIWVMGLTVALVLVFELSLEPYASLVKLYWSWKSTRLPSNWHTMPWSNLVGWAVTTTLILLFVTPVLINKSSRKLPANYCPLLIWELLNLVLLTGTARQHLTSTVVLIAVQIVVVAICATLGAKKSST